MIRTLPPQPWMRERPTRTLLAAFAAVGITARFVGGCVRDTLLGLPIADIDLATPARPEAVMAALQKAGLKAVPTGIAHGTVTAVVPPRHFEITTLRRDVETDGRHARVAFGADWAADAARRDFTINALYLDPDGTVHDPVGGLPDLAAHRVRFVGDPGRRIAEDVLRILRYYRFEARFGTAAGDAAARAACRAAANLLPTLSPERVAQELLRLLGVKQPVRALSMMTDDGVFQAILPAEKCLVRLERLIVHELVHQYTADPIRRLAALIEIDAADAAALAERLRFSNADRKRLVGMARPWPLTATADLKAQRAALYRLGRDRYRDIALLLAADQALGAASLQHLLTPLDQWQAPEFPLAGRDVVALGVPPGPEIGRLLAALHRWWEAGDFRADRAACLAQLRIVVERRDTPTTPPA